MSRDKAIKHGKEKRKAYRGSKAIDTSCRNHGRCPYCKRNRLFKNLKYKIEAELQLEESIEELQEDVESDIE
jgi:hypothetical protein